MPPSYARISRIFDMPKTLEELTMMLNQRLEDINEILGVIAVADSEMRGNDGFTPKFNADVDVGRNRMTNIERSRNPRDAVTRVELEELGLFSNDGTVRFTGDVVFRKSARSEAPPGGGNALITEARIRELILEILAEELAVAFDGERLTIRQLGINGTDPGNPLMGRDDTGRAEFISSFDHQLSVQDRDVITLLTLVLVELRRISGADSDRLDDAESG